MTRIVQERLNEPAYIDDWGNVPDPFTETSELTGYLALNPGLPIEQRNKAMHSLARSPYTANQQAKIEKRARRRYMHDVIAEEISETLKHVDALVVFDGYSE